MDELIKSEVEKNKKEQNEKDEIIKKLEENIKIKDENIKNNENIIKSKEDLISQKEKEIELNNNKIKETEEKLKYTEKLLEDNKIKYEEEIKNKDELIKVEIEKSKKEIEKYLTEIKDINDKLKQTEEKLNNEKEKYNKIIKENEEKEKNKELEIKNKGDEYKNILDKKDRDLKEKDELLKNKENELKDLKEKLKSEQNKYKNEINNYIKKEEELQSEIGKYKSQLDENMKKIKTQEDNIKSMNDNLNKNLNSSEENIKKLEEKFNNEKHEYLRQIKDNENKIKMMDELIKIEVEKNKKEQNEKNEMIKKLEENINNKDNILKQKEDIITKIQNDKKSADEKNEEKLKNLEKSLNEKIKEYEEKIKNKDAQIKNEKEQFNKQLNETKEINKKLKTEIENYKKELSEKGKIDANNEKNKPTETATKNDLEVRPISLPEENPEFLQNTLSDILLQLDNQKHHLSIFDLLTKTLENYDKLKYFQIAYQKQLIDSSLDYIYYFYNYIKSYFAIGQNNTSLKDLLTQNSFIFSDNNESNDLFEKIKSINLGKNINIMKLYETKKENYIKKLEPTFNSLKEKMLFDINLSSSKNDIKKHKFIKISEPKMDLEINFDEINKEQNTAKFNIFNSLNSKLNELTLLISNFPIFLIYSLIVKCSNLKSLKIFFITEKGRSKNNENIENLCQVIPILIQLMSNLEAIELINFPYNPKKIPDFVDVLKNSKIKKLSLINCFAKKDGVTSLTPYFTHPTKTLQEINISEYNFDIISFLSNSLLNIQHNKNLTSINFTNCNLSEDDISHIANFIVSSNSILSCDISKNNLSTKSCSQFGYCILKSTTLETLVMNECGITGETLLFLFNAKGSKSIKKIYLNDNNFSDIGLVSISAFIKSSPEMEIVEVKNCGGTDMGLMNLANCIKLIQGNKLKSVNYLENNITDVTFDLLKQLNDVFKNKGFVFILNKIPGKTEKVKLDCVVFKSIFN